MTADHMQRFDICGYEVEPGVICNGSEADPDMHADQCPARLARNERDSA